MPNLMEHNRIRWQKVHENEHDMQRRIELKKIGIVREDHCNDIPHSQIHASQCTTLIVSSFKKTHGPVKVVLRAYLDWNMNKANRNYGWAEQQINLYQRFFRSNSI